MRVAPSYRVDHAGPGLAQGYAALARRYEGEGRGPEALQAWRKAALAAPADADLQNALGKAEARQGDRDAAVATFQRALVLAPGQAALLNNLGYALMLAGRDEEARTALRRALALQPGHPRAQANLDNLGVPAAELEAVTGAKTGTDTAAVAVPGAIPGAETGPAVAVPAPAVAPVVQGPGPTGVEGAVAAVEIANGNGINGMAACMADALRARGAIASARLRNALPYDTPTTVVRYRAGHAEAAQTLASLLPGGVQTVAGTDSPNSLALRVVLGHDLRTGSLCTRRT